MKECRVCGANARWTLKSKDEFDRHYCTLTHLAEELNEAMETGYSTPDLEGKNARFFKKGR